MRELSIVAILLSFITVEMEDNSIFDTTKIRKLILGSIKGKDLKHCRAK